MANTNYIVDTTNQIITSSDSNAQHYPVILSSGGNQSLSSILLIYQVDTTLLSFYKTYNTTAYNIINNAFSQTYYTTNIGGIDLETTYTVTFSSTAFDSTQSFTITWLNADATIPEYTTLTSTAASISDLVDYINSNITTVTASYTSLVMTITPNDETPNQLVRISFPNLEYTDYIFEGSNILPDDIALTIDALITAVPTIEGFNYYGFYLIGSLFMSNVSDDDTTKITNTTDIATEVEATNSYGDAAKVIFFDTADTDNYTTSTSSLSYILKQLSYNRSTTLLDINQGGINLGIMVYNFYLDNGNIMAIANSLSGYTSGNYTRTQMNQMFELTQSGITSSCNNCNFYTTYSSYSSPLYAPGVVCASGEYMQNIILGDNVPYEIRGAIISLLNSKASVGSSVPLTDSGVNLIKAQIRGIMTDFYNAGYTQSYGTGNNTACYITGGEYSSTTTVISGIQVYYSPAGSVNKVYVTTYEDLSSSSTTTNTILSNNRWRKAMWSGKTKIIPANLAPKYDRLKLKNARRFRNKRINGMNFQRN